MAWARGSVSTFQARLWAPTSPGPSQAISSFWRTVRPLATGRLWQVEPPQDATPSCTPTRPATGADPGSGAASGAGAAAIDAAQAIAMASRPTIFAIRPRPIVTPRCPPREES
jgi:hypothetical protein